MATEQLTRKVLHRTSVEKPQVNSRRKKFLIIGGNTCDFNFFIEGVGIDKQKDVMSLPLHKLTLRDRTISIGGNGVNMGSALGLLEQDVTLITPSPSSDAIDLLNNRGVDVVALHPEERSGKVKESFILNSVDYHGDRVILREPVDRNYDIEIQDIINNQRLPEPNVIILSSVDGDSWPNIYRKTTEYAKANNKILATLPASQQTELEPGNPELHFALENADIICLNKREITNLLKARDVHVDTETPMLDLILLAAREFGYDTTISVTDGGNPSFLYTKDNRVLKLQRFGDGSKTPLGAGDAYAAVLIDGLAQGEAPEDSMIAAAVNAYNTTLKLDAQSGHQTRDQISVQIDMHPDFTPTVVFDAKNHNTKITGASSIA